MVFDDPKSPDLRGGHFPSANHHHYQPEAHLEYRNHSNHPLQPMLVLSHHQKQHDRQFQLQHRRHDSLLYPASPPTSPYHHIDPNHHHPRHHHHHNHHQQLIQEHCYIDPASGDPTSLQELPSSPQSSTPPIMVMEWPHFINPYGANYQGGHPSFFQVRSDNPGARGPVTMFQHQLITHPQYEVLNSGHFGTPAASADLSGSDTLSSMDNSPFCSGASSDAGYSSVETLASSYSTDEMPDIKTPIDDEAIMQDDTTDAGVLRRSHQQAQHQVHSPYCNGPWDHHHHYLEMMDEKVPQSLCVPDVIQGQHNEIIQQPFWPSIDAQIQFFPELSMANMIPHQHGLPTGMVPVDGSTQGHSPSYEQRNGHAHFHWHLANATSQGFEPCPEIRSTQYNCDVDSKHTMAREQNSAKVIEHGRLQSSPMQRTSPQYIRRNDSAKYCHGVPTPYDSPCSDDYSPPCSPCSPCSTSSRSELDMDDDCELVVVGGGERSARDQLLLSLRTKGWTYKEIREKCNFSEQESTLRGRYRTLTKEKEARVRKPEWQENDIKLLKQAVRKLGQMSSKGEFKKVSWKQVAEYISDNGGSYSFGYATCRKRWDELVARQGHAKRK